MNTFKNKLDLIIFRLSTEMNNSSNSQIIYSEKVFFYRTSVVTHSYV